MIFVARQLVEETLEHDYSLFIVFADLRKAYDWVPRNALHAIPYFYSTLESTAEVWNPTNNVEHHQIFSQWDASFHQSGIIFMGKF
jgi:hypothetical protein